MSAAFTPGPWVASIEARPTPSTGHWYVVLDEDENGLGEFYGDDHEANVANVRLAGAAPEMFEALLQYADDLRRPPDGDSRERRLERVWQVIAKARGEAA